VHLYGTTNTSYAVFIDGQEQKVAAVADNLVFQKADLTDGAHSREFDSFPLILLSRDWG
jgi:hypothetical protein